MTSQPANTMRGNVQPKLASLPSTIPPFPRPFIFLRLPGELRDQIYQLLAVTPSGCGRLGHRRILAVQGDHDAHRYHAFVDEPGHSFHPYQPALSRTCRQIRTEFLPVFYGTNAFRFIIVDFRYDLFLKWAQSMKREHARLIPNLALELWGFGWTNPLAFLEAKEYFFKPEMKVACRGSNNGTRVFMQACQVGDQLRKAGVSWDLVGRALGLTDRIIEAAEYWEGIRAKDYLATNWDDQVRHGLETYGPYIHCWEVDEDLCECNDSLNTMITK